MTSSGCSDRPLPSFLIQSYSVSLAERLEAAPSYASTGASTEFMSNRAIKAEFVQHQRSSHSEIVPRPPPSA